MRLGYCVAAALLVACSGSTAQQGLIVPPDAGPTPCVPISCAQRGRDCGPLDDGCGNTLQCGECTAPLTCGGAGVAGVCGAPSCPGDPDDAFCARHGFECGEAFDVDLCGAVRRVNCGSCAAPRECGARTANLCGLKDCQGETDPELCAQAEKECGTIAVVDRCGERRRASCGVCTAPMSCEENLCRCAETDAQLCARLGKTCGALPALDACGAERLAHCGTCPVGETCNATNACEVCRETDAAFCARLGKECGRVAGTDQCGVARAVECGSCVAPKACGPANTCDSCVESDADFCARLGKNCGAVTATDACGVANRTVACGTCPALQVCGADNRCAACAPETDAQLCARLGKTCGAVAATDNCGQPRTVTCGTCNAPQVCGANNVCTGCVAESGAQFCIRLNKNCGSVTAADNCGASRTAACGTCASGQSCGATNQCSCSTAGDCAAPLECGASRCGCVPTTCAALGRTCGKVPDGCGGELDCGSCPAGQTPAPYCIRVMAANITSGNLQSYDPGEGIRIFQGIKPDIAMVQEFNYGANTTAAIRGFIASTFGAGFWHFREPGDQIPNGVVSRFPIVDSGEWDDTQVSNRDFVWARIDVPGPRDLWVVSLHLLTASASVRNTEATALVRLIQQHVPAGDYLVIGGDFNTDTRTEAALGTLGAVVQTAGPHPDDGASSPKEGTNASRSKPYDWVLANAALRALQGPVIIGARSFADGLVFDSRVYQPLTDVAPVRSGDSGATNMQHMAVVKEFCLPL